MVMERVLVMMVIKVMTVMTVVMMIMVVVVVRRMWMWVLKLATSYIHLIGSDKKEYDYRDYSKMNPALTPVTHLFIHISPFQHFQSTASLVQVSQTRWKYSPDSFAMCMPHFPPPFRTHPMFLKFQQSWNIHHETQRGKLSWWLQCYTAVIHRGSLGWKDIGSNFQTSISGKNSSSYAAKNENVKQFLVKRQWSPFSQRKYGQDFDQSYHKLISWPPNRSYKLSI